MSAIPAKPKFSRGEEVSYLDREGRAQFGNIKQIIAHWVWSDTPSISYVVTHPSYRNNKFETTDKSFRHVSLAPTQPEPTRGQSDEM